MIGDEKQSNRRDFRYILGKLKDIRITKTLSLKSLFITIAIISFIVIFPMISPAGGLTVGIDDDSIGISYNIDNAVQLRFADVQSAELINVVDAGRLISGNEDEKIKFGTFNNEIFGDYQLYQNTSVEKYIVIHTDEVVVVFNLSTLRKTESFYDELMERIQEL